jgi:hypothetical protein
VTLDKPVWLTRERLRIFREEEEPISEELNPEDPDWENVPKPDQIIMLQDDDEAIDSTKLGEIKGKVRVLSWKSDELVADDYIERSGNETTLKGRETKTSAVALFADGGTTIIRFIHNILIEELLQQWSD